MEFPPDQAPESSLANFIRIDCANERWQSTQGSTAHRTRRRIGEEDRIIRMNGGMVMWLELKSGDAKLSAAQQLNLQWARILGHTIHVVRGKDQWLAIKEAAKNSGAGVSHTFRMEIDLIRETLSGSL